MFNYNNFFILLIIINFPKNYYKKVWDTQINEPQPLTLIHEELNTALKMIQLWIRQELKSKIFNLLTNRKIIKNVRKQKSTRRHSKMDPKEQKLFSFCIKFQIGKGIMKRISFFDTGSSRDVI
jgi:hypothetical protein